MATISANGDSAVGELLSKAMETIGKNGVITVKVHSYGLQGGWIILVCMRAWVGVQGMSCLFLSLTVLTLPSPRMARHWQMSWRLLKECSLTEVSSHHILSTHLKVSG